MTKQLPHLVMGGRVTDPQGADFENLDDIDIARKPAGLTRQSSTIVEC